MKEYELWNSETDTGAVAAETGEAFRIEAYQTEDGTLKVYLNHTGVMEQDCYTIQIGNETLEVQNDLYRCLRIRLLPLWSRVWIRNRCLRQSIILNLSIRKETLDDSRRD